MRRLIIGAFALALVGALLGVQPGTETRADPAGKIYWTDTGTGKIQRANHDGSNVEDLVTGLDGPDSIALDAAAGKMYWTDTGTGKIQCANLDGTGVEDVVTGLDGPRGIALDVDGGKMYWAATGKIQRANLDGSDMEDLVTVDGYATGMALDVADGKMYWTRSPTAFPAVWSIQRANLDGTGIEEPVTVSFPPFYSMGDIALDVTNGKMYWNSGAYMPYMPGNPYPWCAAYLRRANLDGSNVETLHAEGVDGSTMCGFSAVALDVGNDGLYWADLPDGEIRRANLDGSDAEDLITGLDSPSGIALDLPFPPPPTPTATATATRPDTPTPVGGSGLLPDESGAAALPAAGGGADSGGSTAGWGIAAVAVLGATALGGAAWYARRQRVGRR